jgi:cytochrome c oxidase subunit 2
MERWLRLPIAASADAPRFDHELALVHWLMLALFVGWSVYFVYALVRFRRGRQPRANARQGTGRAALIVGGAVLVAELALLMFYSLPAWRSRVTEFPSEQQSTVVRVVAEQFAWNIHYPGADGRFGRTDLTLVSPTNPLGLDRRDPSARDDVTAINEMHLPVDRPVIVYLSSKDVVHSFTLPQMRVKQDAIPGTIQAVWFTPVRTGVWEIACSQLCGLAHYRMRGIYRVESDTDFRAWLASQAVAEP